MKPTRLLFVAVSAALVAFALNPAQVGASTIPSGERAVGGGVVEPVYNDEKAGSVGYVLTPTNAPMNANPAAWSPFYVPVYPTTSTVGTLLCMHMPVENCPTHGTALALAAAAIMPSVYGPADGSGVLGHDHLMDFPGGSDFNIEWEPLLVLFTSTAAADEHLLTDDQIAAAVARGDAIEIRVPALTFNCALGPCLGLGYGYAPGIENKPISGGPRSSAPGSSLDWPALGGP
jgi:hypothetical protein